MKFWLAHDQVVCEWRVSLSIRLYPQLYPTLNHIRFYYMASSASGQDEPNRALWLATREGKMEPSCPLGTTRCIPQAKFPQKPYNMWPYLRKPGFRKKWKTRCTTHSATHCLCVATLCKALSTFPNATPTVHSTLPRWTQRFPNSFHNALPVTLHYYNHFGKFLSRYSDIVILFNPCPTTNNYCVKV